MQLNSCNPGPQQSDPWKVDWPNTESFTLSSCCPDQPPLEQVLMPATESGPMFFQQWTKYVAAPHARYLQVLQMLPLNSRVAHSIWAGRCLDCLLPSAVTSNRCFALCCSLSRCHHHADWKIFGVQWVF